MQETEMEKEWREEVQNNNEFNAEEKQRKLEKLQESYWHRRLINADYWK